MTAPRRVDALRNRAAIVRAAGESVLRGGRMPSLPQVARSVGLGQATVYRHFPDRRSLLLAVTREHLAALHRAAERAADDPAAFRCLLREVLVRQVVMRPLVEELRTLPRSDQRGQLRRLLDALSGPFARALAEGQFRRPMVLDDVAVVFSMFQAAVESAPTPEAARRVIPLLLDGLFHTGAAER